MPATTETEHYPSLNKPGDEELSRKAEALYRGYFIRPGHVLGESVIGLLINKDFNAGVQEGPFKASDKAIEPFVETGWTPDEARAYAEVQEQNRRVGVNTYPFTNESVTDDFNSEMVAISKAVVDRKNKTSEK